MDAAVPLPCRSLRDAAAARLGWRRPYGGAAEVDMLLTEQSETAYTAAGRAVQGTTKNHNALAVQPGVLDARGRILVDVFCLEGALSGAHNCGLPSVVIARLEDVVDYGHEMTVLLGATVCATAAARPGSGS
ncbi:hypothetical protein [Streptomyces sp. NPDC047071]|uniref:hypothetical protein n=1 Tax=Streptomyces sp. NPDC047071 TaxID=3154808 RepID=UPI003454F716